MKIWVYLDGRQQGPYELEELFDLPVDENTKVWFDGLPRWCAAGEIEELRCLFDSNSPVHDTPANEQTETGEQTETDTVVEETAEAVPLQESKPKSPYTPGRRTPHRELPEEPGPSTYLGWSIALTICCCSPLRLGALVASICVTSFYQGGNVEKARKASEVAAWLIMIAIALGFFPVMLMSSIFGG